MIFDNFNKHRFVPPYNGSNNIIRHFKLESEYNYRRDERYINIGCWGINGLQRVNERLIEHS